MEGSAQIITLSDGNFLHSSSFALDVLNGLTDNPKSIPSKYLYDEIGSLLFETITEQKEYYLTGRELEILNSRKEDILQLTEGAPFRLVELGVGDARKTKILLNHFINNDLDFHYILIDMCKDSIKNTVAALKQDYTIPLTGIISDYSTALSWLKEQSSIKTIVLFLGASIGNFDPPQSKEFLHQLWNALDDGDIAFIGFDLKKDIPTLQKAYNDTGGVTREFNLNLLDRMNKELDANFNRDCFTHYGFYNPAKGRMESWLISTCSQSVTVGKLKRAFTFDPWEGIHLENSYKYSLTEIESFAEATGFIHCQKMLDSQRYFLDAIWQVKKLR